MKLAFVIQEIYPGAGQTQNISEIIKYLSSVHEDWSFDVLAYRIVYPIVEGLRRKNVCVVRIDQYYSSIILRKKLSSKLSEYDLVYIKGSFPYVFPASSSDKPFILVIHQRDSPSMFKSYGAKLKIAATNAITGHLIKKPTALVTVSEELSRYYSEKYRVNPIAIEDQISDSFFVSTAREFPSFSRQVKLISVGAWDEGGHKRQDFLLRHFASALDTYKNMKMTLVGLLPENVPKLSLLSSQLGISENTMIRGYVPEPELLQLLLESDIYATATTYEGFYRPVVEAFATGMPALVYDARSEVKNMSHCAATNHILKSKAGLLYKDSSTFVEGIEKILQDYSVYSDRAKKYAQSFTSKNMGKKTDTLIESLISSSTSRGNSFS